MLFDSIEMDEQDFLVKATSHKTKKLSQRLERLSKFNKHNRKKVNRVINKQINEEQD